MCLTRWPLGICFSVHFIVSRYVCYFVFYEIQKQQTTQDKAFNEIEKSFFTHFDTLSELKKILMDDLNPDPVPTSTTLEEMRAFTVALDR